MTKKEVIARGRLGIEDSYVHTAAFAAAHAADDIVSIIEAIKSMDEHGLLGHALAHHAKAGAELAHMTKVLSQRLKELSWEFERG